MKKTYDKRVIYKYELPVSDSPVIKMPIGAEILCVDNQNDTLYIWAIIDPNAEQVSMKFKVFVTGQIINDNLVLKRDFIGTVLFNNGSLVFHVFYMGIVEDTNE